MRWLIMAMAALVLQGSVAELKGDDPAQKEPMTRDTRMVLDAVGRVGKTQDRIVLEIRPELVDAIDGLEAGRSIWVFWWFDRNDTPEKRSILKVHPRGNPANPLRGVFATRSPVRPNLIGLTLCRIVGIEGSRIEVDAIDAFPGTPILDIKPYIRRMDEPGD